jgi:hypothetical protein
MIHAKLIRHSYAEKFTLGTFFVFLDEDPNSDICHVETLELPWLDNKPYKSCIPTGTYWVVKRYSHRFGTHFHLVDVPGRTWILIHPANFVHELSGCIAPGVAHEDIDGDGLIDTVKSVEAMNILLAALPDSFKLEIV